MVVYLIPTIIGMCLLWKFPRDVNQYGVLFGYYIVSHLIPNPGQIPNQSTIDRILCYIARARPPTPRQ